MSIREKIQCYGTKMHVFVDMGTNIDTDNKNPVHAKTALVFMPVGVNEHWKMRMGYFYSGPKWN